MKALGFFPIKNFLALSHVEVWSHGMGGKTEACEIVALWRIQNLREMFDRWRKCRKEIVTVLPFLRRSFFYSFEIINKNVLFLYL